MRRHPQRRGAAAVLLAATALAIAGCGSETPLTPHEQPVFTAEDAAFQSALITLGMVHVLDQIAAKGVPGVEAVTGSPYVTGEYWRESDPDHVWTDADHHVDVQFPHLQPFHLYFDLTSAAGLVDGGGRLTADTETVRFTVAEVEAPPGVTPVAGELHITTGWYASTVSFHADHTATVSVDGRTWLIDLDSFQITEI